MTTELEFELAMAIGEKAVVADALETGGQGVLQEKADKLLGGNRHELAQRVAVVGPGKGDLAVLERDQAPIADGYAMGVAAEVLQDMSRSAEGWFGVDHPWGGLEGLEETGKGSGIAAAFPCTEPLEFPLGKRLAESRQHAFAETAGERFDGQEKLAFGGEPALVIGGQAAAGDDTVQMRVEMQVLAPAMEHREETQFRAKPLAGEVQQGSGGGLKEEVVDHVFVVEGEGGDRFGQGEDHVEVLGGQQFGAAVLEPLFPRDALALGAMAVAAGAVANMGELAVVAPFFNAAQHGRAAGFDGAHQAELMQR